MWFLIWPVSHTDGTMLLCWLVTYFFSMIIKKQNMYVCLWCLNCQSALCIKDQANINTRTITMMMMTISSILCMHQKDLKILATTTIKHRYLKYFSSQAIQKQNKKKQRRKKETRHTLLFRSFCLSSDSARLVWNKKSLVKHAHKQADKWW